MCGHVSWVCSAKCNFTTGCACVASAVFAPCIACSVCHTFSLLTHALPAFHGLLCRSTDVSTRSWVCFATPRGSTLHHRGRGLPLMVSIFSVGQLSCDAFTYGHRPQGGSVASCVVALTLVLETMCHGCDCNMYAVIHAQLRSHWLES